MPVQTLLPSTHSVNFRTPLPLRIALLVSCFLLALVGILFYFFPSVGSDYWIWVLKPAKARMLGALYLSAFAPMALAGWINRWAPVRLVLVMLAVFTTLCLVISGLHGAQLSPRSMTKLWFVLYCAESSLSLYYVWRYRNRPTAKPIPLSKQWTLYLVFQAAVLGLYGIGLWIFPTFLTLFWPWTIRPFHGRLYSSVFLAGAVGSGLLAQSTSALELFTLGLSQVLFGGLEVAGLVLSKLDYGELEWAQVQFWVAALLGVAIAGVAMITRSAQEASFNSSRLE